MRLHNDGVDGTGVLVGQTVIVAEVVLGPVTWDLGGDVPPIGITVDHRAGGSARYMLVHNIGEGPKMQDVLFRWKITGHYRYFGPGN